MKNTGFIYGILYFFLPIALYGQESDTLTSPAIQVIYEIHSDSLRIKWAPATPETWLWGTKYGYTLTRHAIEQTDTTFNFNTTVIDSVVMPYNRAQFTTLFNTHPDSNYLMVQAQAIYSEWELKNQERNPAVFYMQSQEFINRYSYSVLAADLSWESALAGGLAYEIEIDTSIAYFYEVRLNHPDTTKAVLGITYVHNVPVENIKPHISKIQENDGSITIYWDKKIYETFYTAYHVERAENPEGPYIQITEHPYISSGLNEESQMYYAYSDSLATNYETMYYRIVGINSFGRKSQPSEPIKAAGKDHTSPEAAQIDTCYRIDINKIQINWVASSSKDISGYLIWKARPSTVDFEVASSVLISKSATSYIDSSAIYDRYYYVVQTIDTAGNASQSSSFYFFEYDSIPPPQPLNVRGVIDTNGIVLLQWDHLAETEDLLGYKVLFANESDHVFSSATPKYYDYNTFIDTISLDNLSHQVYYKVMAIDQNFNQSEFSKILKLEKPDTIPPLAPQIQKVDQVNGEFTLQWAPSPSRDVIRHEVEFNSYTDTSKWKVWQSSNHHDKDFKIQLPDNLTQGSVRIVAIDQGGNKTYSFERWVSHRGVTDEVVLKIVSFEVTQENEQFALRWYCENCTSATRYKVYRKEENEALKLISTTKQFKYIDKFIKQGTKYEYIVKPFESNSRGVFSSPQMITMQ